MKVRILKNKHSTDVGEHDGEKAHRKKFMKTKRKLKKLRRRQGARGKQTKNGKCEV